MAKKGVGQQRQRRSERRPWVGSTVPSCKHCGSWGHYGAGNFKKQTRERLYSLEISPHLCCVRLPVQKCKMELIPATMHSVDLNQRRTRVLHAFATRAPCVLHPCSAASCHCAAAPAAFGLTACVVEKGPDPPDGCKYKETHANLTDLSSARVAVRCGSS